MKRIPICSVGDVPANGMKCFDTALGVKVLVANAGGTFHGYQGMCPHQEVCLDEGFFDGSTITCHQHLWQWDVGTGAAIGEAEMPLERFALEQDGDALFIVQSSVLKACELFKGADDEVIARLDALARRESRDSLATLYDVGDPADDVWVLESGRVEFIVGRDDRTSPAGFMLRKGEVFGWAALLEDHPRRIARAACAEPSTLLRLKGEEVLRVLGESPASGYRVMRQLSALITRHLRPQGGR